MSRGKRQKHLSIEVSYYNNDDLYVILEQVKRQIRTGLDSSKGVVAGCPFTYNLNFEFLEGLEYRYETINGNDCIVIPSSMNN